MAISKEKRLKRKAISIVIIFAGLLVLYNVLSLIKPEEEKIRRIIYAVKEATEKEDSIQCMSFISNGYSDNEGNNKAMLFRVVQGLFKTYDNMLIDIESSEIAIDGKINAQARLVCFGQGRRTDKTKGVVLDTQKVEFLVLFGKENGHWKVCELRFIDPENFMQLLLG